MISPDPTGQAPSRAIARQLAADIRVDYANALPSALACFEDDFEACIAHLRLPVTHRRFARTTNLLERLFVEERRRLKIIPNGFGVCRDLGHRSAGTTLNGCKNDVTLVVAAGEDIPLAYASRMLAAARRSVSLASRKSC